MKKIKLNKRKYNFGWKEKGTIAVFVIILIAGFTYEILRGINTWFDSHVLQFNQPISVELKKPIEVREREIEVNTLVQVIETIPAPEDLETDPEKLIYKYFGIEHYRMAIAVSKCEGLNHPADGFNTNSNGSIDVGYMRINSVHFQKEGCSLLDVATPEGNISCGHKIWDQADGIEGNNQGSFQAWVGYTNGCALTKYD